MPQTAPSAPRFGPWYWDRFNLFEGADPAARGEFFARTECLQVRRGRHLFRATDPATRAYFVHSGTIKIYHLSPDGMVTVFWFCSEGDVLGPGAVAGTSLQYVNAQAIEDTTVFAIRRKDFEDVLRMHPQLALNMIKMVGSRLRLASEMMIDRAYLRSEERLARLLLRLAQHWGSPSLAGIELRLRISHQELANMIGSCRQTVNTILHRLERDGSLSIDGRVITICGPGKLMALARLDSEHVLPASSDAEIA